MTTTYITIYNNLNTSHVKVNQSQGRLLMQLLYYLNTSHVKVNQPHEKLKAIELIHLNTSHVKVNLLLSQGRSPS